MSALSLSLGADAPEELTLLALGLVKQGELSSTRTRAISLVDDRSEGDELEVRGERGTTTISSRPGSFVIGSANGPAAEVPWFLGVNPPRAVRLGSSRLRIGIAGGSDERRLKMSWRTIAELRRRGGSITAIVIGECAMSPVAEEQPDEVHSAPAPAEYLALLDRLDVVLECTDSFSGESFLPVAARDRGVPVVAHLDRPDLAIGGSGAAMWSADGFVDAVLETTRETMPPRDVTEPLRAILELIDEQ